MPPKSSNVAGQDIYHYQTSDIIDLVNPSNSYVPSCDGKRLGQVPYVIYFVTEQPRNLPNLSMLTLNPDGTIASETPITNGHCLIL